MKQVLRFLALAALICVPWVTQGQQSLPYSYGFEDNDLSTDGWTTVNESTSNAGEFGINTAAKKTGTYGFRFSSYTRDYTSYNQYLISPELAGTNGVVVTFCYAASSSYGTETFKVGYSTTDDDISSFTFGDEISTSSTSWTLSEEFNFPAGTKYVAIYYYSDYQYRLYVDDISFTAPASCPKPTGLAAGNVSASGATLTWNVGSEEDWVLQYGTDENFAAYTEVNVSTTPSQAISGLTAQTTYYVRVKADCGGDESDWSNTYSFTTTCAAVSVSSEDYTYGFETADPFGCWNVISGTVSRLQYNTHAGSYRLDFRGTTSNMVALPPFEEATNTLRVEFWTRPENNSSDNSYSGKFAVGYMTDINDASTFVPVATYNSTSWASSPAYEKKTVDLVGAPTGARIVFRQFDCSYNYYWYVDDVTVTLAPSCVAPTALFATPATDEAELSWTANSSETAWTLYWKEASATDFTEVTGVTENPYTLDGLTPATTYQFKVVANCSSTDASEASDVYEFQTLCEAIAALGYTENFDSYSPAAVYTPTARELPNCWKYINTCTYSSYKFYPSMSSNSPGTYAFSESNYLKLYSYDDYYGTYDAQPQYAILPEMTGLAGKQVTMMVKGYNSSSTFHVGLMTDPADASTFTEIINAGNPSLSTSYQEFTYDVPGDVAANSRLAIMIDAADYYTSSYNGVYIDDISIDNIPTCIKPSGLMLNSPSAKTAHTATLKWTNGEAGQNAWQIAYIPQDDYDADVEINDANGWTIVNVTDNPATINGLDVSTAYYAYVRADCGNDDYSRWCTNKYSFTTLAGSQPPTDLAVDNSTITSSAATVNWTGVATNDYHQSFDIYYSGFSTRPEPLVADSLIEGLTDASYAFTQLDAEKKYYVWVRDNCGTDGYSEWSSSTYFTTASACQTPDGLDKENVTSTSATITWNTYGRTGFNLRYSTDGESWTTIENINTSPYTFTTPLSPNTAYQVQVQVNCEDVWSTVLNFRTECAPWTITDVFYINEDFESYSGTAYSANNASCVVPYCWDKYSEGTTYIPHVVSGGSYNYYHSSSQSLNLIGDGDHSAYVALPEMTNDLNTLMVKFWMKTENTSAAYKLSLGYITDEDVNYNTYQVIVEYDNTTTLTERTTYLPQEATIPATATRLVFRWAHSGSSWHACCIDDVVVKLAPSCYPVGTLAAATEITAHSAKLSWALVDDNQDAWEVQYATNSTFTAGVNTFDADAHADVTMDGLAQSTTYYVHVRANCGGDYGDWSNTISFTTITGKAAPTGLAVEQATITSSSATASWTGVATNVNHANYEIYWDFATVTEVPADVDLDEPNYISGITATSKTITGLAEETEYKVWVRDNCDVDGKSDWSSPVTFTTAAACQTPDGLAATNVGAHSATITWNDYGLTAFNLWYKEVGAAEWEQKNATEQPCDLDGLAANKTYNVKVQPASCTSAPEWSDELTFSTPCEAITITVATPYIEDFEAPVTTATYNTSTVADLIVPACWDNYYNTNSNVYALPHIIKSDAGSSYNFSSPASQVVFFYGANGYAIMPEFSNDLSDLQISFKWAVESKSYGTLTLGYITDEDNGTCNTFQTIQEFASSTATAAKTMEVATVYLSGVPATAAHLVFRWSGTNYYYCNIDDIKVSLITKDIAANQWYAIASPTHNSGDDMTVAGVDNLTDGTYDLLGYNETNATWKQPSDLERGKGYIYRNAADKTLTFNGTANSGDIDVTLTATDAAGTMKGWNLLGNPYAHTYALTRDCYSLSANGTWTVHAGSYTMAVAEAVLVKSNSTETFHFTETPSTKSAPASTIAFTVSNDEFTDIAYARFSSEEGLPKISHLNPEAPMLSIDGYAIANLNEGIESFPMSFSGQGSYTLTVSGNTDVTGYLHLVDRVTGRDIDLLSTPSYSFTGSPVSDRFTVKLTPDANEGNSTSRFAIFDGNSFVINGEGTLEVYDVMGRRLMSAEVTGSEYRIPGSDLHTGVYVLRMNGNSQKIVIK